MAVTREQVLQVAALAHLHVDEIEVQQLTRDLNTILEHMAALDAADVSGAEALSGVVEWPAPLRADVPGTDPLAFPPAELSPHWESGFFTVPTLPAHESDAG